MVKTSQYVELANDLEINKAITYLRQKDFNQVQYFHKHFTVYEHVYIESWTEYNFISLTNWNIILLHESIYEKV